MILNATKGLVIAEHYILCKTPWQRARGLMLSKPKVLVFEFAKPQTIALHMWFVFFPIDVAFLDANMQVVEIKRGFKPFSFYVAKALAKYVIETPWGGLRKTGLGDRVSIVPNNTQTKTFKKH